MKLAGRGAGPSQEGVHTKGASQVRWVRSSSFYCGRDKQRQQGEGPVTYNSLGERQCGGGDDSPVSVINNFNMQLSHPSSACTSMEHPLSPLAGPPAGLHPAPPPPPPPPPLLLKRPPPAHQYPPPQDQGSLSERVHQAFSKSHELITSKSELNSGIWESRNGTCDESLNRRSDDEHPWLKKRMEWLNLQAEEGAPCNGFSQTCVESHVQNGATSSPDDTQLDDHAAEEVFSLYTRDQDEDSVIDFFPSARPSSAMQLRRRSDDRINYELNNGLRSTNDNPERVLLLGKYREAGMKKAMRHTSGRHDDAEEEEGEGEEEEEEAWSGGRLSSSKWDDAERWLTSPASSRVRSHSNNHGHLHFMLAKAGGRHQLFQTAANSYKLSDPSTQDKHVPESLKIDNSGKFSRSSHGALGLLREAGTEVKLEHKRDMATQSTPAEWSRSDSPDAEISIYGAGAEKAALANYGTGAEKGVSSQKTSPPRHNTPARRSVSCSKQGGTRHGPGCAPIHYSGKLNLVELESCHLDKLKLARDLPLGTSSTWQLYPEEDAESTLICDKFLERKIPIYENASYPKVNMLEARVSAWEDVERAKHIAKFKREEAKIEAWESLQRAEADAELRKLEVKLEKMRFEGRDKIMGRLGAAQRRAQEMRGAAEAHKSEQLTRVEMRANQIRKSGHLTSSAFNVVCSLTTRIKPTSSMSFA